MLESIKKNNAVWVAFLIVRVLFTHWIVAIIGKKLLEWPSSNGWTTMKAPRSLFTLRVNCVLKIVFIEWYQ